MALTKSKSVIVASTSQAVGATTRGTLDELLAPAYTSNAMARQRATRLLSERRIDTATARAVLTRTDAARTAREHIAAAEHMMEIAR